MNPYQALARWGGLLGVGALRTSHAPRFIFLTYLIFQYIDSIILGEGHNSLGKGQKLKVSTKCGARELVNHAFITQLPSF